MTKKLNNFKNIITVLLALLLLGIAVGPASAAVTNLNVSAGMHFYGENITVTWTSPSALPSYIWINSNITWDGDISNTNWVIWNNLTGVPINKTSVLSTGTGPYSFTYTFANWTVNDSINNLAVYVNDANNDTFPTGVPATFMINAYNITITNGRSSADGNSTLAGDQIIVNLNTSGLQAATTRDNLPFSLSLPEANNTVTAAAGTSDGNYTFTITATKGGVGALTNIKLNYGSNFSWNSTQLASNAGLGATTRFQFNVSVLNLKAYEMNGTKTVFQNITSVNVTTILDGDVVRANLSYPINITLSRAPSTLKFNTMSNATNSKSATTMNLTVFAGQSEGMDTNTTQEFYGNYTWPVTGNLSENVSSATTGSITATVNTSGMTWTDDFIIHPITDSNVLTAPAVGTSYQIGNLVNITGWNSTKVLPTLNITDSNGVLINSTTVTINPTDGSFAYTWDTNYTWNTIQSTTWNATNNKTGVYTLTLGSDSHTINLGENITVVPTTSIVVNGTLLINGTTDRWNSNGTTMYINISTLPNKGGTTINGTINKIITGFKATTGLASYNTSWNSSFDLNNIISSNTVTSNTFDKTYYITVNDSAATGTASFQITDNISVSPASAVPGMNFTVSGTSARSNGTNISVNVYSSGLPGVPATNPGYATVQNNIWNVTMNASTTSNTPLSNLYTYTVSANDSIVIDTAVLTLGTGSITLVTLPDTTLDGIVWFNGTTNLPSGTVMYFNVSKGTTVINQSTKVVDSNQNFNLSWRVNTSEIPTTANFTTPTTMYTVMAFNGTFSTNKTLNVTANLIITTPDFEIAPDGEFRIDGTYNRVNSTSLTVETFKAGIRTDTSTASLFGSKFNTTRRANLTVGGSGALPAGIYTITVTDGTNATASINMTVAPATVTLSTPVDSASFFVNDTIPVSGTSNIGNSTNVTVRISRISGPTGWTPFTSTLYGTTNFTGYWNTTWNSSADSTFQVLSTKIGSYQVSAWNGSTYSITHTLTLTAANGTIAGTITNATSGAAISGATVTAGSVTATTVDGSYSISIAAGTYTVTATATGYESNSTSVTVTSGATTTANLALAATEVSNEPPVIASLSPLSVVQYNTTQLTVTATDPEGQPLFYAWDFNNDGDFEIGRSTTNTLYHTFSTNGTNTIRVHVDDGVVSTEQAFSITVTPATIPSGNNNDPVIVSVSPVVVSTVGLSTLTLSATDADAGTTLYYAWDINGDGLFESGRSTGNTISTTIDSTRVINVRVDDGTRVTTQAVTIAASATGANALPTFTAATPLTATVNVPTTFTLSATDGDSFPNAVSYMVDADNSGTYDKVFVGSTSADRSTINQVSITFTTTGSKTVPVRVDDGVGITTSYFTVVVS